MKMMTRKLKKKKMMMKNRWPRKQEKKRERKQKKRKMSRLVVEVITGTWHQCHPHFVRRLYNDRQN